MLTVFVSLRVHQKYTKFVSVGLPVSTNDYISRNERKSLIFGVMPYGRNVDYLFMKINDT